MTNTDGYTHGYTFDNNLPAMTTKEEWAAEVLAIAQTNPSELYEAACGYYANANTAQPLEEYAQAHVQGQIDRAKEITGQQ